MNNNEEELKCDVCGMPYSDFLKTGVFGCQNCYTVFKKKTVQIMKHKINSQKGNDKNSDKNNLKSNILNQINISPRSAKRKKYNKNEMIKELEDLLKKYEEIGDNEKIEETKKTLKKLKNNEIEKI